MRLQGSWRSRNRKFWRCSLFCRTHSRFLPKTILYVLIRHHDIQHNDSQQKDTNHNVILFYFSLGSTLLRSTFVCTHHFFAKPILGCCHFEDDSSPHISGSSSLIRIDLIFVLFKHVILIWINYLETWLSSDNTLCYYTGGLAETQGFLLPLVNN